MKQLFSLIKKEFFHIARDKRSLFVLLGMPIAQILIFGFALTNEVKDARIAILDQSKDVHTEGLIQQIEASRYFDIERQLTSVSEIEGAFRSGKIKLAVVFEPNFAENIAHSGSTNLQLIADASDPVEVGHVCRSYDSCLVCTVHAHDAKTGAELARFRTA